METILNSGIIGFLDLTAEGVVIGWAFSPSDDKPLSLYLIIDGFQVAATICDIPRPDVLNAGISQENVGFRFDIPEIYFDGAKHVIQINTQEDMPIVFRDDEGHEQQEWIFTGSPEYTVSCMDQWQGGDVHCWAVVIDRLTGGARPADYVIIRQGEHKVTTLFPTISRPDIADTYNSPLVCGFVLPSYIIDTLPGTSALSFYVYPDGRQILGSPIDIPVSKTRASDAGSALPISESASLAPEVSLPLSIGDSDNEARKIRDLAASGLFDEAYYLRSYPDIARANIAAFEHFFQFGHLEGRWPNLYFDPIWYATQNPEVQTQGQQPLLHYLTCGDREGRNPSLLFDVNWYRDRYNIPLEDNTLAHYLKFHFEIPLSPNADFDADYYAAEYPDVFAAKVDLFDHFFKYGYKELRNPSADFDVKFYTQRYLNGSLSENPLIHFWAHRQEAGVYGRPPEDEVTVSREIKRFCRPGPFFEEFQPPPRSFKKQAMLLAYYLPQFHAFSENDAWWGNGFTEWTNIVRGSPRFVGHYQPRVPRDLGFYSLDTTEPMRRQIDLALASGVSGFVFYYYWFNGKRLMEQPLERFLADPSLNMKFALMWANENWTRRWDGAESEVLISQDYLAGDDHAMASEFARHFRDPRYIRLQGRPLLMIYRAGIIPDTQAEIARWRKIFRAEFNEDPIFVMAQAFKAEDPAEFGFDGAIEFPPHKLTTYMAPKNIEFKYLDDDYAGAIHRYDDVVDISLSEPTPNYPFIKTAVPSWDNDARRQGTGLTITGSTPQKYEAWLSKLVRIAKENPFFGEPIVCVNAWNEWCEGAYLEPDLHFGSAYLNATARALTGRTRSTSVPRMLLVGHDAFPGGAQQLLLNIGRVLRAEFGMEFAYILLGEGKLEAQYAALGPLSVVKTDDQLSARLKILAEAGFNAAIVNTSAAGRAVAYLGAENIPSILLVHELPRILREKHLKEHARLGIEKASATVFPAAFVRDATLRELGLEANAATHLLPQGSYKDIQFDPALRRKIRREFGLTAKDHLILGVGYADMRKGFDLFLQLWRLLEEASSAPSNAGRIFLIWVGDIDPSLADWLGEEIATAEATGRFKMAGYRDDMPALFSAASAFALTSREDPLPSVVLEALGAGLPVAAFDRSGGIPDLLRGLEEGVVVPFGDVGTMARALTGLIRRGIKLPDRERRHAKMRAQFDFTSYVRDLVKLALPDLASISVAVPNYNYAAYMPDRLGSIFQQTYPVQEVLVLDDCSTDNSTEVIPAIAHEAGRTIKLAVNETNSGSVFIQWRRAAEMACGEFVWIAEADDLSDPDFLASMTSLLSSDPDIKLAFSDSRTIHGDGSPQWESYKSYYATTEPGALRETAVFDAGEFVCRFLAVKNLILNASAVVWRREALLQALDACENELTGLRMAGDWLLYLTVLAIPGARIGYEARTLNIHRRHAASVTHALDANRHISEIARCHAFAGENFALPQSIERQQGAYLAEITAQLGATVPKSEFSAPSAIDFVSAK